MNDEIISKLAFVRSSKHRENIILSIGYGIKIPTELAKNIDISSKHISKYLGELKDNNIVVCLNEQDKRGRLYKLTPIGKEILEYL